MKKLALLAAVVALAAAASVHASAPNRSGLHFGDPRPLGTGTASAWVAVDVDGSVPSMGVSIDEAAMRVAGHAGEIEAVLPLPKDVTVAGATAKTAFRVRYDRERRTWLVMLDGLAPAVAAPAAWSAQAVTR